MTLSSPLVDHKPINKVEQHPRQCNLFSKNTQTSISIGGLGMLDLSFLPLLQVAATVNVFDNEDGSVAHPFEQPPEVRVGFDLSELKIVYVKLEAVGHCSDQAGLVGARWTIQQVAEVDNGLGLGFALDHVHLEVPVLVVHGLGRVDDEGEVRLGRSSAPPIVGAGNAVGGSVAGLGGGSIVGVSRETRHQVYLTPSWM
ncbi:hypothetical protein ABZP36_014364 [Zizania latifolia]